VHVPVGERYARPTPRGFPTEASIVAGAATVVGGCLAITWVFPPHATTSRLIMLALVVAGLAAVIRNGTAAVVTAGLAFPLYLGFLLDREGELHWHGEADALRLTVLVAASLVGTTVGRSLARGRSGVAGPSLVYRPAEPYDPNDLDRGIESHV
jgi:hypothetical protein